MAPIKIQWDPEILAAGFRPSSIFDEAEANTTMASTSSAPVDVVGAQSTVATAHPAHNVTGVLNDLAKELAERVVALVVNTTTPLTTTTPSPTSTTTTMTPDWTTSTTTTFKRAVESATTRPGILVEHVSIIFIMIC